MTASKPMLSVPTSRPGRAPINGLLIRLLRSPLHGLADQRHLVISYEGRRSGVRHELPVQFAASDHGYIVLVGRPETKRWWRNFQEPWPLTVVMQGRSVSAVGRVVVGGDSEAAALAGRYFASFRGGGRRHGLENRHGEPPSPDQLRRVSTGLLFLEIVPAGDSADRRDAHQDRPQGSTDDT